MSEASFGHPVAFVRGIWDGIFSASSRRDAVRLDVTIRMHQPLTSDEAPALDSLRKAGVKINRVLPRIRVVTGSVDPGQLTQLRAMPEVMSVEEDRAVKVQPISDPI
ncbi:hypothetical protein [Bradyrhizobium sp.]|uniref:hypothetical protein n=1 Tax=Bradyrhizobium sp. TaxID=376 RepID=UPI003C6EF5DD